MKQVEPVVFLVGNTQTNPIGIKQYFHHIGIENWKTNASNDIEYLCEFFGRGCYESWEPGYNLNVSRIREGNDVYLSNILKSGHGSVLEHTWLNWMICDVSRVFTHELVRHRVGTAISQESLRFYRPKELSFWMPGDLDEIVSTQKGTLKIQQVENAKEIILESVVYLEDQMRRLNEVFQIDDIKGFEIKKRLTTIIRRIAPEGQATNIGWSCNVRTLRHLLEMRTDPGSEEEIRLVFGKIGYQVKEKYPNLFGDYDVEIADGLPWYKTEHNKV